MYNELKETIITILFTSSIFIFLFILTALLNMSSKVMFCSGIYILLALTINLLSEVYNKNEAMFAVTACVLPNIILLSRTHIDLLVIISFLSLFISTYTGVNLSDYLRYKFNFPLRNFIVLICSSIIDTLIVGMSLLGKFSLNKCLMIVSYDLSFKVFYSIVITILIYGIYNIKNNFMSLVEKYK
jgi:hypothetical protein